MLNISLVSNEYAFNFIPHVTYINMEGIKQAGYVISIGWLSWSLDFDCFPSGE